MECHVGFDHYSSTKVLKHASRVGQPRSGFTTPPGPFGIQDPQGWNPVCVGRFFGGFSKPTKKTIQENGTNWAVIKKLECVKNGRGWSSHLGWDRVCDQEILGRMSRFFPELCWEISSRYFSLWSLLSSWFSGYPPQNWQQKSAGFISHQWVRFRSRQRTRNRARVDENCTWLHGKSKAWICCSLRVVPW